MGMNNNSGQVVVDRYQKMTARNQKRLAKKKIAKSAKRIANRS